jgi:hypothetical protein
MKNNFFILVVICFFISLTSGFLWAPADAGNTATVAISGTVPLITYNVSAGGIGSNNATITWNTNGNANSTVNYGTTTSYGSTSSDDVMVSSHMIGLSSLSSYTVYHYRVTSTTLDGLSATSADASFTTLYPTGTTVATQTQGTTFSGTTTTTVAGAQQVNLTLSTVSGTPAVSGNTVTVSNPGNGWSSLQYTGTSVTDDGQNITVNGMQGVTMKSAPVTADLGGNIGTVSTQITVPLTQLVSGVTVQQNVISGATSSVADAFQVAAANNNLNIQAIAYTVQFQNTGSLNANLGTAGVTLNLSVDDAWVVANGGRSNINILRLGDDGTKEVLTTNYAFSSGSTDYFTAISPHGLSTFGISATSGSGGGNNGGSSSSNSEGSSSISGGFLASLFGVPPEVPVAPAPVAQPGLQLGPFETNATTTTRSLSVAGLTTTTGSAGTQTFLLDTALAEQSGSTITLNNNIIIIRQPGFTLTVVSNDMSVKGNGVISGTVKSVGLRTAPAYANTSVGTVSISVSTPLDSIPENASITTAISDIANQGIQDAFQSAAQSNNQQVEGIAYSIYIGKNNFVAPGPAMVNLTISPDWVTNHGGIQSIGIARLSDEGTSAILKTDYTGSDERGNLVFQGTSPQGLSIFGLISLKNLTAPAPTGAETPAPSPSSQSQSPGEIIRSLAGGIESVMVNNIVMVLVIGGCLILLAIGTGVIVYNRRFRKKNNRNGKNER